jgi:hypothetical protein
MYLLQTKIKPIIPARCWLLAGRAVAVTALRAAQAQATQAAPGAGGYEKNHSSPKISLPHPLGGGSRPQRSEVRDREMKPD